MNNRIKSRISTDLGDPRLIRLLKHEADEKGISMKDVLVYALEAYFSHRLETQALARAAEEIFSEWEDPRDSDYDKL